MMGLLHSLTSAVDAKDAYTCGHSSASRSSAATSRPGGPQRPRRRADLHGAACSTTSARSACPKPCCRRPAGSTTEEFEQIKRHPAIGAKILQDVKQIREIIPGVLHHHERYDGKGYPAGLAGNDIPLMGRIICLADCFDAMTSSRTYRKALPLEVALCEIRRCSGTQFDPALAEVFLRTSPGRLPRAAERPPRQGQEVPRAAGNHPNGVSRQSEHVPNCRNLQPRQQRCPE